MGYLPQYNEIDKNIRIYMKTVLIRLDRQERLLHPYTSEQHKRVKDTLEKWNWNHSATGPSRHAERRTVATGAARQSHRVKARSRDTRRTQYLHRSAFSGTDVQNLEIINQDCAIIIVSHDVGTILQNVERRGMREHHLALSRQAQKFRTGSRNIGCPIELLGQMAICHIGY